MGNEQPASQPSGDGERIPSWARSVGLILALVALIVIALMLVAGAVGHTPPISH